MDAINTPTSEEPRDVSGAELEQEFRQHYNLRSFIFPHRLRGHPLFGLSSLLELARRQADRPGFAYSSAGAVSVADRWDKGTGGQGSLIDTIADIARNNSLVMLKHVEQDPVFGPVVSRLLARMIDLSGPRMRDDVTVGRATVLIASPRRVTSYHIDADTNFLFQIAGDKIFRVYDHTDREVVTETELENYHAGDANGAIFKQTLADDAITYDFRAGFGIHIPSTAPHWARNGDKVSVALSLNYDLRSVRQSGRVYSINRRLRRFGIAPRPPGASWWRDDMKLAAASAADLARHLLGRARSPQPLGWTPR